MSESKLKVSLPPHQSRNNMKISGGIKENGIIIGNTYDKYGSQNPIVQWMMTNFKSALSELVSMASPNTIHEIGCGEGHWVLNWNKQGFLARGSDFSEKIIEIARKNASTHGVPPSIFTPRSIYDIKPHRDSADLLVCCEVLEHLEKPEAGLYALQCVTTKHIIISVPREPIWCFLNLIRGKYLHQWGNTPGHIQHWSHKQFIQLVSNYFHIVKIKAPLPWIMLLCRMK
ncbi:Methyltransferase domain-containing protein [Desulfocicer vacuolatum DSM 3385]|uniref:Methyltransferase domain-containing protein n=1 Tax=Desulfocicer vacuolatum DSM 3385 TaxID=1121400 RepID=A0A1W2BUV2_9BACT|nr:class I SAM-dependent methyltransferase [Desulfocicer vacuolatum]SMC76514.1 Methyltransferase domain-containing protein [Desulfocicer vacuolatum DSM 3385]